MPAGIQNIGQNPIQGPGTHGTQPGALGTVGNLRFKSEPGATPRASGPNIFQRFGQALSELAFYVTASPQARAQRFARDQQEANSRAIGNLLGHLTAPAGDKSALRSVAAGLARLGDLSGGDLARLPGGKEALSRHLQSLGLLDLTALKSGVLSDPGMRAAALALVDPGLRLQAGAVLDQVLQALTAREAGQALAEPLCSLSGALAGQPVDGQALHQALGRLSEGLSMLQGQGQDMLKCYLRELPDDQLRVLAQAMQYDGQGALDVLELEPGLARRDQDLLGRVQEAVQGEARARLDAFSASLAQHLSQSLSMPGADPEALQRQAWQACVDQVARLGHGSPGGVLLTALALPKAMTGLEPAAIGTLLGALPQPRFSELCKAGGGLKLPEGNRLSLMLAQQHGLRQAAAAQTAREALSRLGEAMARGDRAQVSLMINVYKDSVRALRETHALDGSEPPQEFMLSQATLQRLKDDFGVDYDQEGLIVSVTLSEDQRAKLAPHLEQPVPGMGPGQTAAPPRTVTLPLDGVDTEFTVHETFFKDGIERSSVTLSVKGTGTDGQEVDAPWPSGTPKDQRAPFMGRALHALRQVAGPMAEPLTRMMNQQLGAAILLGLRDMGEDSPFKLPDGSVVMPIGTGAMDFKVEKQQDGSFKLDAMIRIPVENAVKIDKHQGAMPVAMEPDTSWVEVSLGLVVAPDGLTVRDAQPPRMRYNFTMLSE